jgi:hypothetical protein
LIAPAIFAANFAVLPFELRDCDRLHEIHGPRVFCLPIIFVTIPIFGIVTAIRGLILVMRHVW